VYGKKKKLAMRFPDFLFGGKGEILKSPNKFRNWRSVYHMLELCFEFFQDDGSLLGIGNTFMKPLEILS
jgi:hypothetical protein